METFLKAEWDGEKRNIVFYVVLILAIDTVLEKRKENYKQAARLLTTEEDSEKKNEISVSRKVNNVAIV